ncbi:hypothetical protein JCM3766R1_000720 [Sporobolomyces carnicolor]
MSHPGPTYVDPRSPSSSSSSSSAPPPLGFDARATRPQLSLATATTTTGQNGPSTASSTETVRQQQQQQQLTDVNTSSTSTTTSSRAQSHGRSVSMSEHQYLSSFGHNGGSGSAYRSTFPDPEYPFQEGYAASNMGESVVSSSSSTTTVSGAQLARRNNTVGASNSRLARLERNRARIALQGAGLSEEDQEFYVPPSPARAGPYANVPWSDIGHGGASAYEIDPNNLSSLVSPIESTFDRHARSFSSNSQSSNVVAAAAAWARAGGPPPPPPPPVESRARTVSQPQQQQHQNVVVPEPKRSSFVVLRGGKGDSKLTERRPANAISPPPIDLTEQQRRVSPSPAEAVEMTAGATQLRHKNSLKPFLDQEREEREQGGRAEEDWERGLMDERKSGAEGGAEGEFDEDDHAASWLQSDPYATLKTPPLSSSFPSHLASPFGTNSHSNAHSRSSTFHAPPARTQTDPWTSTSGFQGASYPAAAEEDASIRRHQSLNSFRSREPSETSGGHQLLSSSPGSTHEVVAREPLLERAHSLSHVQTNSGHGQPSSLGSLAGSTIAGFGSRSRSGTSPAPLTLQHSHSLGHASPTALQQQQQQRAGLSHSTSLGSRKKSNVSLSAGSLGGGGAGGGGGGGGSLSPSLTGVMSGLKSPWSPTEEETKQLGMGPLGNSAAAASAATAAGSVSPNGSGSLSRGGSGSSRGSHHLGGGSDEQVVAVTRLGDQLGGMQIAGGYHHRDAGLPPQAGSTSPAPQSQYPRSSPALNVSSSSSSHTTTRRLAPLMTTPEALSPNSQHTFASRQGPASASAFVPPIGHSHHGFARGGVMGDISEYPASTGSNFTNVFAEPNDSAYLPAAPALPSQQPPAHPQPSHQLQTPVMYGHSIAPVAPGIAPPPPSFHSQLHPQHVSAFPGGPSSTEWSRQKEFLLGASSNAAAVTGPLSASTVVPSASVPPRSTLSSVPAQVQQQHLTASPADWNLMQQQQAQISLLQSQMAQALKAMDAITAQTGHQHHQQHLAANTLRDQQQRVDEAVAETPIDVNSLVQKKGYNPTVFDLRPPSARFFVIKSYTEEDVHKSLKYEIWASTDLGNKRLDKAFRESADKGPIYLFFSVNASGHFAGMAQMLTPVDYSLTSNVWASDKWKGVLKVRWIYIKDVPLNALRHIRLNNTPENKPVTSSRDTQEVPYDAGLEVLRIIATYQSRASLLQDFAWYEAQHRLDRATTHDEGGGGLNESMSSAAGTTNVVPPRQAHYARADRNQTPGSNGNGTSVVPAPPSHQQQQQQQPLAPPSPSAYPQFVPPTPPQQQQQRQPFRSFWKGPPVPNGGPSSPSSRPPSNGPRQQRSTPPHVGQYDGPGVAY